MKKLVFLVAAVFFAGTAFFASALEVSLDGTPINVSGNIVHVQGPSSRRPIG